MEERVVLSFTPAQISHAYGFDNIFFPSSGGGMIQGDGTGQTIAIVVANRQPNLVADLHAFSLAYGLPEAQITICNQFGSTDPATLPALANSAWGTEATLDVQWAHALAPGARLLVVEANSNSNVDLFQAVDVARQAGAGAYAALPYSTVVSMSWGSTDLARANPSSLFTTPVGKSGVTFVASTGDFGAVGEYPAAHPYVLAVGGTTLVLDSQGNYSSEVAWSGSGGGLSPNPAPAYQQGLQPFNTASNGRRMTPDVSFDGSPAGSVFVYDSYDFPSSPWVGMYGTSFGAPAWAALVAIADQGLSLSGASPLTGEQTLTNLYAIYGNGNYQYAFHDVTSGSNVNYAAGAGYDLVTGLGSPRANVVAATLAGYSLTPTASGPTGTIVTTTPTFAWSAIGGATGYYLTIVDTTTQQTIANNLSVNGLSYTSAPLTSGHSYQWQAQAYDEVGALGPASAPQSFSIAVATVNHAPAGADKTITTLEDTAYTFTAADFGFTDPNDTPANTLLAVKISTLPVAGSLTNNGVAATAGQFITLASINAGLLRYTPTPNASGANYASFTFQVQDNGGTANGDVDLDPTPNAITVNVTAVNDAPVGVDKTITTLEDSAYTFTAADFGFSDPNDTPANTLLAVKISTLPVAGSLTNNGVAVTAGQFITLASINAGLLRYTPTPNASGANYASFTFQVQDNGGTANGGVDLDPTPNTITVNVTAVNDAPAGANKTITTSQDTAYSFVITDFGFSDANDTPSNTLLAVRISSLPTAGSLTNNGSAVIVGQYVSLASIAGGLLRFTPAPNASGAAYATFTFQVEDNGGVANGGVDLDPTPRTMTIDVTPAPMTSSSVWPLSAVPATLDSGDPQGVEVGMKFSSTTSGYITGVRFYKAVGNTGVHTGSLWAANGSLLATGTFVNETASGWQTLLFATPVAITAGVTYTASYHTNVGHFSVTRGGFNSAFSSGPFVVPANGGVYLYGAGGFPSLTYGGSNYWIDVLLSTVAPADTTAPTVTAFSPAGGATNVSVTAGLTITFSEALSAASVTSSNFQLLDGATVVAATVTYNAGGNTVTLTPIVALANAKTYTISVTGGANGVRDVAGNTLAATVTSVFTTAAAAPPTSSVWALNAVPAALDSGDPQGVEVGMKFSSTTSGYITGVRFYKAVGNTGVHTGSLWSTAGQLLATGTFVNETASGWQTLVFATPVAITAGLTYTASYHTNVGHFSVTRGGFNSALISGPLTVPANGGVYLYGAGGFPSQTYGGSNYWIDVLLSTAAPADTTAPTIASFTPGGGAAGVAITAGVTITFSEALSTASVTTSTVRLLDGATPVAATVAYNAGSNTVTLTPTLALGNSKIYTISITGGASGVKDVAGNALAATVTSSFTTAAVAPATTSVWSTSTVPATLDSGDPQAVELGMKFIANVNGYITGVRFYKAVANTGVHTGSLWSSTGQRLATGTFVNETASGWQTLLFATPVAITAGVTYIASYHTNVGRFSVTRGGFNSAYVSGPFTVPANGGVYLYGAGGFPSQTYGGSNYWIDVLFANSV